jgi:hypothetical protein
MSKFVTYDGTDLVVRKASFAGGCSWLDHITGTFGKGLPEKQNSALARLDRCGGKWSATLTSAFGHEPMEHRARTHTHRLCCLHDRPLDHRRDRSGSFASECL